MSKQSQITLDVTVDENHVPESMSGSAPDGGVEKAEADAFMLSVWDAKAKDTLRIDLWTKGMQVEDMKRFYHQTLLAMADGLERSRIGSIARIQRQESLTEMPHQRLVA